MDPKDSVINKILEARLRDIYSTRFQRVDIQSIMQYPLKTDQYVVIYNLNIQDSPPIIRAKIVVDTTTEELKPYEPALL